MSFAEKMMEMSPGVLLPVPETYQASEAVATFFTWYAGPGLCLILLPWVFWRLFKLKDTVPLMMFIGGLVTSLQESALDTMGHLWWPTNLPGPAYIGYQLHVPFLIPPCYVFFIAMTGYWAYTRMKQGLTVKGVFIVWMLVASTDIIMEMPGTSTGAYIYYGDAPFKILGFPLAWGWINGTAMLTVGFLLWLIVPYVQTGWRRLLVILIPPAGFGGAYGIVSWPYFDALNFPMPVYATCLWTLVSLALCLVMVRFIAAVVAHASAAHQSSPLEALLGRALQVASKAGR